MSFEWNNFFSCSLTAFLSQYLKLIYETEKKRSWNFFLSFEKRTRRLMNINKNQGLMFAASRRLYGSRIVIPTCLNLSTFRFELPSLSVESCRFVYLPNNFCVILRVRFSMELCDSSFDPRQQIHPLEKNPFFKLNERISQ